MPWCMASFSFQEDLIPFRFGGKLCQSPGIKCETSIPNHRRQLATQKIPLNRFFRRWKALWMQTCDPNRSQGCCLCRKVVVLSFGLHVNVSNFLHSRSPGLLKFRSTIMASISKYFQHTMWCKHVRRLQSLRNMLTSPKQSTDFSARLQMLWLRASGEHLVVLVDFHKHGCTEHMSCQVVHVFFQFTSQRCQKPHISWPLCKPSFNSLKKPWYKPEFIMPRSSARQMSEHVFRIPADHKPFQLFRRWCFATRLMRSVMISCRSNMSQSQVWMFLRLCSGPLDSFRSSHNPGTLVLTSAAFESGEQLTQPQFLGKLGVVFQAFRDLWQPMWCKHEQTPDNHWDSVLMELLPHVPTPAQPLCPSPITVEQWVKSLKAKKPTSATGPDSVSREDLIRMPPLRSCKHWLTSLTKSSRVTCPGQPVQWLAISRPWRNMTSGARDYRPICVISQVYRCWASIRSRDMLQWLHEFSPPHLSGNRPGQCTKSVWWQLAQQIECATTHQEGLTGLMTDVVKCFNTIPRFLIMALSRRLNVAPSFLRIPTQSGGYFLG